MVGRGALIKPWVFQEYKEVRQFGRNAASEWVARIMHMHVLCWCSSACLRACVCERMRVFLCLHVRARVCVCVCVLCVCKDY
jgi:tRNA-dihydrouridine synthase